MKKGKEVFSYSIYKRDLIFNSPGSFSHLDVLFGSCTETGNIFSSQEVPIRKDILEKLRFNNKIRIIKANKEINNFFKSTIAEFQKENTKASIFLVQKNEYVEVRGGDFEKSDYRSYISGRIVLNSESGHPVYRDVDCGSLAENVLIANFKKAAIELSLKRKKALKSNKLAGNTVTTVVFSPGTAGFLIHEVFGHLLEADIISRKISIFGDKIKLGDRVAAEGFDVIDDVSGYESYIGLNHIDDEGTDIKSLYLVDNGILSGYICHKSAVETLGYKDYSGNARRENYKKKSLPRMRATFIKEKENGLTLDKYIESVDDGFLVNSILSGNVNPSNGLFYLYCDNGAKIKHGEVTENVHDFFLSGLIHNSLMGIRGIGSDFRFFPTFCIKGGQKVPVCVGSPSIIIGDLNLGALTYGM